ncbi:DUF86 domain-containing protein [uncultured Varibaculum sp.]|uniref:HepT-like ribonuclease domain-containing protein n=1 Tax=uncultured Varibaculum sp. TaxID=413896 RepID=UPI00258F5087|nr:HepT-like ribonuclease domain-containing protein [uncultured Varibaculum sp.]
MDNSKTNGYYLNKIILDLEFVIAHTEGYSQAEFEHNELLVDSTLFRLIQVSENSNKLAKNFKQQHPSIPWRAMKGLRNRIVHEYGNVDLSVVYVTVRDDIPELLRNLKSLE